MKKITLLLIPIFILSTLFYFFHVYKIDGTSMNYGLVDGDIVLSKHYFDSINRGDLLVVRHPQDPEMRLYIKRCAALPSDRFFQNERSFFLQIKGDSDKTYQLAQTHDLEAISTKEGYFIKDPYLKYYAVVHNWRLKVPKVLTELPVTTVSADHYFMLGDYRDNSADSRFFGAVPYEWVRSKVIYIFKKPRDWMMLINIKETDD